MERKYMTIEIPTDKAEEARDILSRFPELFRIMDIGRFDRSPKYDYIFDQTFMLLSQWAIDLCLKGRMSTEWTDGELSEAIFEIACEITHRWDDDETEEPIIYDMVDDYGVQELKRRFPVEKDFIVRINQPGWVKARGIDAEDAMERVRQQGYAGTAKIEFDDWEVVRAEEE